MWEKIDSRASTSKWQNDKTYQQSEEYEDN